MVAASLLVALLSFGALPAPSSAAERLRVVLANVGNVNVAACNDQAFKLCLRAVEERGARELRALAPDLVGLIEVLPVDRCRTDPSTNPANLCSAPLSAGTQPERLLGPGVTSACDTRFGWDCLSARDGRLRLADLRTRPVLPGCEDVGFTLSTATLRVRGWPVSAAVAHPDSMDAGCRAAQVRDLLGAALPEAGPAIVLGDLNLDPYREQDASVDAWNAFVPSRFRPLTGRDLTFFPLSPSQADATGNVLDMGAERQQAARTIDHVLARDGVGGTCAVRRVDGGGGMDHRAQVCDVVIGDEVTPRVRLTRARRLGCRITAAFLPDPPHLRGVRFRFADGSVAEDRSAPFVVRQRGGKQRLTVQALLTTGDGPRMPRLVRACR